MGFFSFLSNIISGLGGGSSTTGNKGAPAASGNTSNTTIAAATSSSSSSGNARSNSARNRAMTGGSSSSSSSSSSGSSSGSSSSSSSSSRPVISGVLTETPTGSVSTMLTGSNAGQTFTESDITTEKPDRTESAGASALNDTIGGNSSSSSTTTSTSSGFEERSSRKNEGRSKKPSGPKLPSLLQKPAAPTTTEETTITTPAPETPTVTPTPAVPAQSAGSNILQETTGTKKPEGNTPAAALTADSFTESINAIFDNKAETVTASTSSGSVGSNILQEIANANKPAPETPTVTPTPAIPAQPAGSNALQEIINTSSSGSNILQEVANANKQETTITEAARENAAVTEIKNEMLDNFVEQIAPEPTPQKPAEGVELVTVTPTQQAIKDSGTVTQVNAGINTPDIINGQKVEGQILTAQKTLENETRQDIRDNIIVGNVFTAAETILTNPDGSINLTGNINEQLEKWDTYDSSGDYRADKAIAAAVELPTYFLGGGVAGGAAKAAQAGLSKVGSTVIGGKIVNVATTPIVKASTVVNPVTAAAAKINTKIDDALKVTTSPTVSAGLSTAQKAVTAVDDVVKTKLPGIVEGVTTPTAAVVNTATAAYAVDVGTRIAAQETAADKLEYAAGVALKEIPLGIAGGIAGFKAVDKLTDAAKTIGRTKVDFEEIGVSGIPLGNYSPQSLKASFEENKLLPNPYKYARTTETSNPNTPAKLAKEQTDYIEAWHATGSGQYFGKELTVAAGSSEVSGLYTAPKAISYFFGETEAKVKPSLFVSAFNRAAEPKAVNLRVSRDIKYLDWDKAIKDSPYSAAEVRGSKELTKEVGDAYIDKVAGYGELTAPLMKNEYEAVIKPGSTFTRVRSKYYTEYNGRKIPIDEYEPTNAARKQTDIETGETKPAVSKVKPTTSSSRRKVKDKNSYSPLAGYRPAGFTASVSYPSAKSSGGLSLVSGFSVSSGSSGTSGKPSAGPSVVSVVSGSSSGKTSGKTSAAATSPQRISGINYKGFKITPADLERDRKKDDLKKELKTYTAARTGRIDHLSIIDPAEMLGRGSMTDRTRPDRILRKQELYYVDGRLTTNKPKGRVRK